jgi:hypothetical protein
MRFLINFLRKDLDLFLFISYQTLDTFQLGPLFYDLVFLVRDLLLLLHVFSIKAYDYVSYRLTS